MSPFPVETLRTPFVRAALAAAALLLVPLVAMQFTEEVNWSPVDFLVAGVLLFGAVSAWQLALARTSEKTYRLAMGMAIMAMLLLVWGNLAVGVIGAEDNPVNLLYFAVPVVGFIGAVIVGFRPRGMAFALLGAALTQALVTLTAFVTGWGDPWGEPMEVVLVNGFFVLLFCAAAWLFRRSVPGSGALRW